MNPLEKLAAIADAFETNELNAITHDIKDFEKLVSKKLANK